VKDIIVNWYGTPSQGQGYSGQNELLAIALDHIEGFDVHFISPSKVIMKNLTSDGKRLINKSFVYGDVGITLGFPNSFSSIINRHKIGFTMFETDKLPNGVNSGQPNEWSGITGRASDMCNLMDELWVPCQHNVDLFKREGVKMPIKKMNLGYDIRMYQDESERRAKTRKNRPFTFLMTGTLTSRKNPGYVIAAFMELFMNEGPEKVKLILKTTSGTLSHFIFPKGINIEVIDKYVTSQEMNRLYAESDCFVFPSRGEGYGVPPVEAMATGLPAIIADNTGMSEFANDEYNYPIRKHNKVPSGRFPQNWGDVGSWYDPDFKELKQLMKHVYNNQKEGIDKGMKAAKWVRANYTMENTARKMAKDIRLLIEKNDQ